MAIGLVRADFDDLALHDGRLVRDHGKRFENALGQFGRGHDLLDHRDVFFAHGELVRVALLDQHERALLVVQFLLQELENCLDCVKILLLAQTRELVERQPFARGKQQGLDLILEVTHTLRYDSPSFFNFFSSTNLSRNGMSSFGCTPT